MKEYLVEWDSEEDGRIPKATSTKAIKEFELVINLRGSVIVHVEQNGHDACVVYGWRQFGQTVEL